MGKKKKAAQPSAKKTAQPVLTSYFESLDDVEAVKQAAEIAGVSTSALVRDAVMPIVAKIYAKKFGKCPTCGAPVKVKP